MNSDAGPILTFALPEVAEGELSGDPRPTGRRPLPGTATEGRCYSEPERRRYGELRKAYAWVDQSGEPCPLQTGVSSGLETLDRVSSGLEALDRALGGGFRTAAVHELLAPVDGAAVRTVALLTALRAMERLLEAGTTNLRADSSSRVGCAHEFGGERGVREGGEWSGHDRFGGHSPPYGSTSGTGGGCYSTSGMGADYPPTSGMGAGRYKSGAECYGSAALWLLYVDSAGDFCPPAAARLGLPLERVIVLRAKSELDVLWVCEQALRCPGVVLVASLPRPDAYQSGANHIGGEPSSCESAFSGVPRRVRSRDATFAPDGDGSRRWGVSAPRGFDAYASRRLQLAAETGGTLGLILRDDARAGHTFAESRVRFEPVAPAAERLASPFPPPRLMRVEVMKLRGGRLPAPFLLELPEAAWERDAEFGDRHGRPPRMGVTDSPPGTELGRAACSVPVHAVAAG